MSPATDAQEPTARPTAPSPARAGPKSATGSAERAAGWATVPAAKPMARVTPSPATRVPDFTVNVAPSASVCGPSMVHASRSPA
ncbi:hypothetical protein QF046_001762 [Microbacterium sp. W4I4]|uniref:hypothetical protein n=1 Tax=Microbacterium sp. W4I4 TaxID=3042295 RepID=UPI00278972A8|nr:hypothetical protein [Microbacterium sp. W4I4]MDQ0614121.1 hypothetical protein [Microbacterium sp. W4I4]